MVSKILIVALSLLSLLGFSNLFASNQSDELRVAVASNFLPTLRKLVSIYQTESGDRIKIIAASTGKLYAQIIHGAPFDIFLSADSRRPLLLTQSGHAVAASRFTYALGRIALWKPLNRQKGQPDGQQMGQKSGDCRGEFERGEFRRFAIANPKTAPYGVAAQQLLQQLQLWETLQPRLVRGENIAQALHYVESGSAQLGIVALPQVLLLKREGGCIWEIPTALYEPIVQQAVRLTRSPKVEAAERFLAFLRTPRAAEVIRNSGYGIE